MSLLSEQIRENCRNSIESWRVKFELRAADEIERLEAKLKAQEDGMAAMLNAQADRLVSAARKDMAALEKRIEEFEQSDRLKTHEINVLVKENRQLAKNNPDMAFDDQLGWMHKDSLAVVNELRADQKRLGWLFEFLRRKEIENMIVWKWGNDAECRQAIDDARVSTTVQKILCGP